MDFLTAVSAKIMTISQNCGFQKYFVSHNMILFLKIVADYHNFDFISQNATLKTDFLESQLQFYYSYLRLTVKTVFISHNCTFILVNVTTATLY